MNLIIRLIVNWSAMIPHNLIIGLNKQDYCFVVKLYTHRDILHTVSIVSLITHIDTV